MEELGHGVLDPTTSRDGGRVNLILALKISRDSLHPVSILVDLVPLFAVGVLHFRCVC